MEFLAQGRAEIRITRADVGKRVSVRRLNDGPADSGRFTDTVGVLTSWDEGWLLITRRTGESVRIAEETLVAGKVVPPVPARRRGPAASYRELALVSARAWQPVQSERLGEWLLRAAGGFTRRANSVLPTGDPGMPLGEALAAVADWYGRRALVPYIQAATGAEDTQEALCAALEEQGWRREVTVGVQVGALTPIGDAGGEATERVRLTRAVDTTWLRRYQRSPEPGPEVMKVLSQGPSVWFATVPGEDGGAPAAIGRCVVDGRWAGFMAVEVAPELRRQGLASAVMGALARRALDEGASAAWLQVDEENAAAHALYDRLGFSLHHVYHHYRPAPDGDGRA